MSIANFTVVSLLSMVSCLVSCSTADSASANVTGTVTYLERMALPPSAVLNVQLVDVSRADAPAILLGEQLIETAGRQVPFSFEVLFDAAGIDERMTYAVQARIEEGDRLLFISDQHYAVITRGAPKHVDLVLKAVAGN